MKNHHPMKTYFEEIKTRIFSELSSDEVVILNLTGDDTQFIRVNQAKVRQIGEVQNYFLDITYLLNTKVNAKVNTNSQEVLHKAKAEIALTQNFNHDFEGIKKIIQNWRQVLPLCPADPYATLPKKPSTSDSSTVEVTKGSLLSRDEVLKYLLEPAQSLNITGIYAAGSVIRALAHSLGLFQWFETETFSWDYSLYAKNQKAVKGSYSGQHWDQADEELEAKRAAGRAA
jgi:predicted Zn-dependent protease